MSRYGTREDDQRRLDELNRDIMNVCKQRDEAQADRDRLRAGIRRALALTSSYDADRGNHVPLISNLQARNVLLSALEGTD